MRTRASVWVGRAVSAVVTLALLADAAMGLIAPAKTQAMMQETGFSPAAGPVIGMIAFGCAVLYGLPWTAALGAILLTGFLGGAICTHLRLGELGSPPQIVSLALGVLAWLGLWLRDARLRPLIPWRGG